MTLGFSMFAPLMPNSSTSVFVERRFWLPSGYGCLHGLRFGDVDFGVAYGTPYLCGTAMDYLEAENQLAAGYATELTRLQYSWNAVERLLSILELPSVPEAPGSFNAATRMLQSAFPNESSLPTHYLCVLRHFRNHAMNDVALKTNRKLSAALNNTPWRAISGLLLAGANQLRHVPAHGDIQLPEPKSWGDDQVAEVALPASLHVSRLATQGLALSIQMLIAASFPAAVRLQGSIDPKLGLWQQDQNGCWSRTFTPNVDSLFLQAHLEPPEDDDE
jgi:hypothetical protein